MFEDPLIKACAIPGGRVIVMPRRRVDIFKMIRSIEKAVDDIVNMPVRAVSEPVSMEVKKTILSKLYQFEAKNDKVGEEELRKILDSDLDEFLSQYVSKLRGGEKEFKNNK